VRVFVIPQDATVDDVGQMTFEGCTYCRRHVKSDPGAIMQRSIARLQLPAPGAHQGGSFGTPGGRVGKLADMQIY
jgi:hypothetical protein